MRAQTPENPAALPASLARPEGATWRYVSGPGGRGKCSCAWRWEYADGVLTSGPDPAGKCELAAAADQPCTPTPWLPARVFHLTAARPGAGELCPAEVRRRQHEAEQAARRERLRCHWCEQLAGPASSWPLGCRPRELPPDVRPWSPHFWSDQGKNNLNVDYLCPDCSAIQDRAHREGRSVVITNTSPPKIELGAVYPAPAGA